MLEAKRKAKAEEEDKCKTDELVEKKREDTLEDKTSQEGINKDQHTKTDANEENKNDDGRRAIHFKGMVSSVAPRWMLPKVNTDLNEGSSEEAALHRYWIKPHMIDIARMTEDELH